ncbi:MAG TPA: TGS domain-containing protein, partial [Limnochordia bacterium]|nr:TGS domain-containing protein [Limnochordia bacterium]
MMSATQRMIEIELPDGSKREYPAGTTPLQVAESISRRLAKAAVAAKLDERLIDLNRALEAGGKLEIVTETAADGVDVIRHSTAH